MSDISDCIIKILADNGVSVEQKEIWGFAGKAENVIQLDFSEHDKVFEDKIARLEKELLSVNGEFERQKFIKEMADYENQELKQRIAELESKETSDLPFDALECANYLINATYERETNRIKRAFNNLPDKVNSDRYTVDELEQIAEHLLVYCKHNKESGE